MSPVPYNLFVRFLITKGTTSAEAVNTALEALNLAPIYDELFQAEWELVHSQLSLGLAKQIAAKSYSVDFPRAMKVLCVWDLWRYEKEFKDDYRTVVKLTYDIHQDLQLRLTINALLMKNVPHSDVAQTVNLRFSALLKAEHIDLYERFFFAARSMTRGAWKKYLKRCDDAEKSLYFTALTDTLDTVKTELDLPAKHSTTETLQYLLTKSTARAKRLLSDDSPSARGEAMKWIDTVMKLTDKYEKYRAGDQADLANQVQFEFSFVETEFAQAGEENVVELAAKVKKSGDELEAEKKE